MSYDESFKAFKGLTFENQKDWFTTLMDKYEKYNALEARVKQLEKDTPNNQKDLAKERKVIKRHKREVEDKFQKQVFNDQLEEVVVGRRRVNNKERGDKGS